MRLINTETRRLHMVTDSAAVRYAILSHVWTDDEITFEDMRDLSTASCKSGFAKLDMAIKMAKAHGYRFIWIDTCCIDKSSSAELSEAINSMFRWYKEADVCFAFLYDLPVSGLGTQSWDLNRSEFEKCRWFSRGWTFQELIAPKTVIFFDAGWKIRGQKTEMTNMIESITGIDKSVLGDSSLLPTISIARRMSWAAGRETTRIEDSAYCLMGIFNINMPMIYGEGVKAFLRLQEEILKNTTDLSIFAWQANDDRATRGVLAESAAEFGNCGDVELDIGQFGFHGEVVISNKGVRIPAELYLKFFDESYTMALNCFKRMSNGHRFDIGISLRKVSDTYYRIAPKTIDDFEFNILNTNSNVYLLRTMEKDKENLILGSKEVQILVDFQNYDIRGLNHKIRVVDTEAVPRNYWNELWQSFIFHGLAEFLCFIRFCVVSSISSAPGASTERTNLILICQYDDFDSQEGRPMRLSFLSEAQLQRTAFSGYPHIICPFTQIERYGPFGDRLSLDLLCRKETPVEGSEISISHKDSRFNYSIKAYDLHSPGKVNTIRVQFEVPGEGFG